MRRTVLALALTAIATAAAHGQATVWIVDAQAGPGTDFTTLADAIVAASSGDVVVVRQGLYDETIHLSKGITIQAEVGADVDVAPHYLSAEDAVVRDLPAGETVVIRGLQFASAVFTAGPTHSSLYVENCAGTVWLEECYFAAGNPASLRIRNSRSVVVDRCVMQGADGELTSTPGWPARPGLLIEQTPSASTSVSMIASQVKGGDGSDGVCCAPIIGSGAAAVGCELAGGMLVAVNSHIQGGRGGDGAGASCTVAPKPGATGLWLTNPLAQGYACQTTLNGGGGGSVFFGCPLSSKGEDLTVIAGSFTPLGGQPALLAANSPVREGQTLTATIGANPASATLAFLVVGAAGPPTPMLELAGVLLIGPPQQILALGSVPPSASLTVQASIGELGPSVESAQIALQVVTCGSGTCALGGAANVVLLDAAF